VDVDRNGLEVLPRDECLRLLGSATLGRVGVTTGALPQVLPVNFLMDRERILIRTGRGAKLDAATVNAVVAFEVDEVDEASESGWSVLVTGVAQEVTDAAELAVVSEDPPGRWAPEGNGRVIAISTDLVSGRRTARSGPSAAGEGRA
jgi:nitroimidazol reductase NimA-like FMN-containing flavoprotein (pyridoxamine 5'-phosphate oxidase superfamily)